MIRRLKPALVLVAIFVWMAGGRASAKDLTVMMPDEIRMLQQRLTDAKCYSGPIDGRISPATVDAEKVCPDQEPVLRIEVGMHTARINAVAVDAACTVMATASDDKTVRLWSLPDGRLKQTIRVPIGDVPGGLATAVAMSPDGRWLAIGGFDASSKKLREHGLYLLDTLNMAINRIPKFENVIHSLEFSANGQHLGVVLGGRNGVRVLEMPARKEIMSDRDYGGGTYGLAFTPDGGFVTTSTDGYIRRYGVNFGLSAKVKAVGGSKPFGVSVDPSGELQA